MFNIQGCAVSETAPEDFQITVCPIMLVYRNQMARFGAPSGVDSDIVCSAGCEGILSEPRTIGRVILPHVFDRVYCEKTE